ncbi:MAG: ABC transporter permease [Candidatus Bathyarchaeia archaeon]
MKGRILSLFVIPKLSGRVWKVWLRDRDVFMKTYKTNFIPPFLEPLLYLLALGFGLGFYIQRIEGVSYAAFIAPALISISIMNSAFFECTYGSYVRMYYQKTFDAIIATPVSLEEVIAGELFWGATRSTINASIILGVISFLGLANFPLSLLSVPFSFLAGLLFATIAMCCTAVVPSIDSFNYPFFLLITPMFLFSGTFFPISILPEPVQLIAVGFLPLTHVVNIVRGLTLGKLNATLLTSLAWIAIVCAVLFIFSINLMKKRLVS